MRTFKKHPSSWRYSKPLVTLLVLLLVGGLGTFWWVMGTAGVTLTPDYMVRPIASDDHLVGDPKAPVKIFVYMDLECPYCSHFDQSTRPKLKAAYGNEVVFVYRHFPLSIHPHALKEAEASECVYQGSGEVGFWQFAEALLVSTPGEHAADATRLPLLAQAAGASAAAFASCLEHDATKDRVIADRVEGAALGARVTPSVLVMEGVHSVLVSGDHYAQIAAGIDYVHVLSHP